LELKQISANTLIRTHSEIDFFKFLRFFENFKSLTRSDTLCEHILNLNTSKLSVPGDFEV